MSITVSPLDQSRLETLIRDRNAARKHVWQAEIVLLSMAGAGTVEIMRRTSKSKTCVWRWQERFAEEGIDGLLRDKTRPSRIRMATGSPRGIAGRSSHPACHRTHGLEARPRLARMAIC